MFRHQVVEALDGISSPVLTLHATLADFGCVIRLTGVSSSMTISAVRTFPASIDILKSPAHAEAVVQRTVFDLHAYILNESRSLFPKIGTDPDESLSGSDVQDYCRFWNRVNPYTVLSMLGGGFEFHDRRLILGRVVPFEISAARPVPTTVGGLIVSIAALSKEVDKYTTACSDDAVIDTVKHFKKRLHLLQTGEEWTPPAPPKTVIEELQDHFDLTQRVVCPCWSCKLPRMGEYRPSIADAVVHLNDRENWTREQIADWLEAQDLDLRHKG